MEKGRPSLCLACLREKKVIAGRVAEAYEEADVPIRVIFDGLTGPGTTQRARDEVLMFMREMFDQAFIDGRINCIQAYPGEGLKDVRDRFVQLRDMRQRGVGRMVQVAALVKKE